MYNPEKFKSENIDEAFEFIKNYPFATIINVDSNQPVVSHIPLTPEYHNGKIELIGHMARANSHWKVLTKSPATILFHGPHTYITPKWYADNYVPTWNYSALHVTGTPELIEDYDGIVECLKKLAQHTETQWPSGWEFLIPEDLVGTTLSKSIVGFNLKVESFTFKKKLSQNRSPADRATIITGLRTRSDENSHLVLKGMLKLYSPEGEFKV